MLANPTATKCSMANVLLDTGAQISLISRTLANSLQLSPVGQLLVSINGLTGPNDTSSSPSNHDIVEFQLVTNNGKESIKALVRDTDDIVGSINHPPLSSADLSVIESTLSFIPSHFSDSSICPDLLLGVSDTLKLLDDSKSTTLPCGYRLIQSVIGPLVAGSENIGSTTTTPDQSNPSSSALRVASVVTSTEDSLEKKIEHLFSVDPIARVYDTTERESRKLADESVTRHFDDTIQLRDDGYYVQENANDYDPQLVCQLVSNLYVDNVIINADSPSLGMYTQSKPQLLVHTIHSACSAHCFFLLD
ncbi:hypothetical protein PRIPAC_88453 [Pristionchus pacificus]|uniref:DUF1758 domain-containing protein n=1 Tax=Pristionchus pacificus TaxID=54126 RepID=A0A2A6CXE3_PRIPA|nr:hypothetical protein PRIPAC_88453 [Pristionchus pacificus]|eukprot:PDM82770.1 hypothetical protein PRIPAC_37163 [Pristionchus pacificus]